MTFCEGFESGLWTHRCKVFPTDGDPYLCDIGNVFTPKNWLAWWLHDEGTWDQPEGRNTWEHVDPRRIHSGKGAYMLFSVWRHHDCGLMRQAEVTLGDTLRFTAWAHAWSNHNLEGHEACCDDGRCSCGVGREIVAIPVSGLPELSGDPWGDAIGNSVFVIGIDPTGGTDPFASTVEWGEAYAIYNGYYQLEAQSVAQNSTVTVFLRNITKWNFKHNDGYWDDAELSVVEEEPPDPVPEGRGDPRIQYERTFVLLPPEAGQEWALAVVDSTWNSYRFTLGGSADDAGIGDLDARCVIAINPGQWPGDLQAFYQEYYPGVRYVPVEAATPDILRQILGDEQDIALWQCDPLWANEKMASPGCSLTICQTGCWLTCCAIAQRFLGIKSDATPSTANQALGAVGGFSGCMTLWSGMEAALGLEVFERHCDDQRARDWLDGGFVCFAEVEPESYMHFVLVTKYQEGRFWMYDPYKNVQGWLDEHYSGAESWRSVRPFEQTPLPDFTLRGVHDRCGGAWLEDNNLPGWCTIAGYIGTDPRDFRLADNNVRYILRLSHSYATDDGGEGTMPGPDRLAAHEAAAVETMRLNPSAWGFIYGNEPNNKREWPHGHPLTPAYYLSSYNWVWANKPAGARLSPCAIDPYNAGWGDWRKSWYDVLCKITGCDFLALHAYTHGSDPGLIWHRKEFEDAPLIGVYYDMRVLESQQDIIPSRFWQVPVILTETNHWVKNDGTAGWEPDAGNWVRDMYKYAASKGVAGACLFRHGYEQWRYGDLPDILGALKEVA